MNKIKIDLNLDQEVSSQIAFIFVVILGFVAVWYIIGVGQNVIENYKQAEAFDLESRIKLNEANAAKTSKNKINSPMTQTENNK